MDFKTEELLRQELSVAWSIIDRYRRLEAKYKEAQSLLDGCYEVVELWDCQAPSQIVWKREWLEKARLHGAGGI